MKKNIWKTGILALAATLVVGCSDWTETTPNTYTEDRPDSYYQAIREWKKTDHSVTFGWFGNWTGQGASPVNCLMGLPDSTDFVSMWGNWHSLSAEKWADKRRVKELKGTRVTMCFIVANCGDQTTPPEVRKAYKDENDNPYYMVNGTRYNTEAEAVKAFWGWEDGNQEAIDAAIAKYAKSIIDTIDKYEWDGFDYDYEANWGAPGNIAGGALGKYAPPEVNRQRTNFLTFIKELGKYLGPKSGTGRLLVIDGEPQNMHPDARDYFDYYIIQAYSSYSYTDLDGRYGYLIRGLEAEDDETLKEEVTKKLIWCENFEDHAANGGVNHQTREGDYVRSLKGMAMWEAPSGYRKGGVGTYHMEYEYTVSGHSLQYPYLREASAVMNPPMTSFK